MLRYLAASALAVAGCTRLYVDWQNTIAEGHAYRPAPLGVVLHDTLPTEIYHVIMQLRHGAPWVWEHAAGPAMALPFSVLALGLAMLFWMLRPRKKRRRELF